MRSRKHLLLTAATVVLTFLASSINTHAQETPFPSTEDKLTAAINASANDIKRARSLVAPLSYVGAGISIGWGVAALASNDLGDHPNVAWTAFALGALALGQGVVWQIVSFSPEDRLLRYEQSKPLSAEERLLFEGELRAQRYVIRMEQALMMWSGLGMLFGGALLSGTVYSDRASLNDETQAFGHATAISYGTLGAVMLLASFLSHQSSQSKIKKLGRGTFAPFFVDRGMGLSVVGLF